MQALSINIDIKHTRLVSCSVWLSPGNVRARSLCACAYWRMVSGVRLRDGGCHDIVSRVTHRCHTNTSHFPAVSHSILNNEPRHANQQARITFNWSNWGNGRGRGGLINQKKFINTYSARRKVCEVWSLVTLSRKKGEDLAGLSDLGLVTFWIVDCKVYRSNFENKSSWRFSLK